MVGWVSFSAAAQLSPGLLGSVQWRDIPSLELGAPRVGPVLRVIAVTVLLRALLAWGLGLQSSLLLSQPNLSCVTRMQDAYLLVWQVAPLAPA